MEAPERLKGLGKGCQRGALGLTLCPGQGKRDTTPERVTAGTDRESLSSLGRASLEPY